MKKLYSLLLISILSIASFAQMTWDKFDAGFGVNFFNDVLLTAEADAYYLNYWSAISINGNLSYNLKEWTSERSLSLAVDPLLSFGNFKSESIDFGHFALPIQLKYNLGRGASSSYYSELGINFGAGMVSHWVLSEDSEAKWNPQALVSIGIKARRIQSLLSRFIFKEKQLLPTNEFVFFYGFPAHFERGADIAEEGKFIWLSLMWRRHIW